jgi:signal transduction histidine kinase
MKYWNWIKKIIAPWSTDEDAKRQEYILNIFLLGIITLAIFALLRLAVDVFLVKSAYNGEGILLISIIIFAFIILFFISRFGHHRLAAVILLIIFFLPAAQTAVYWGADLPQPLLIFGIIIIMSGILINSRFAFAAAFFISATLITLSYLQQNNYIKPNSYWVQNATPKVGDALIFSVSLMIMAIASWLSNKEIEKSLWRARRSEAELKAQKDSLEIKVEERTKELKETQLERLNQLDKFAEFGRLSSGVLHDLVNPLTVVTLNLEKLISSSGEMRQSEILGLKDTLGKAMNATKRMENFIIAAKKQIQQNVILENFDITNEVRQVLEVLGYKARKMNVELQLLKNDTLITYGNPVKVNQVISNLISNAIDAYENIDKQRENRKVIISAYKNDNTVFVAVKDWGCGIDAGGKLKIFQPFYTTKSIEKGTGIGLSNCKYIVEKELGGKIFFESSPNSGTCFNLEIPIQKNEK